jgi:arylsulfatase
LWRTGVSFDRHYASATMCTSSRAVLLTGLQTTDNGMFENVDVPWVKELSPAIPTVGHMLRKIGYYAAYKGKWHLNRSFDEGEPVRLFTAEMEQYGFSDYASPGDVVGHTLGGYEFDPLIGASAVTWLRRKGRSLSDERKPWCLVVSLVNPHDVMYFNTDLPGQPVQDNDHLLARAAPTPENSFYRATWDAPPPAQWKQPFDEPGRPRAHGEYQKGWDYALGHIPPEEERWHRLNDFYLNSIRAVDLQIANLLAELDALDLTDQTIVVFTADHGEMAGAHGLRGKGPFAYEESIHVPFHVVHPDVRGGHRCASLTSHIDVTPTLLAMAGADRGRIDEIAGRPLPGKDLTPLLNHPASAPVNSLREGVLFTYSGLILNDSELAKRLSDAAAAGKAPQTVMASGFRPNLHKRGSVRTVFDGRYKLTRYFAPVERNPPTTLDELYRHNDVELFDLETDPDEETNLATDGDAQAQLVLEMSAKLERVIKNEIGVDDGREMPKLDDVTWTVQKDRLD